jgi:uncharacterized protein YjbJ (UPF0337 family)
MGAKSDEVKGRAKEAAGALSGDKQLKREGQAEQTAAAAKGKVREAAGKVDEAIDTAKEKALKATDKSPRNS